jgi:hypothetical protein
MRRIHFDCPRKPLFEAERVLARYRCVMVRAKYAIDGEKTFSRPCRMLEIRLIVVERRLSLPGTGGAGRTTA